MPLLLSKKVQKKKTKIRTASVGWVKDRFEIFGLWSAAVPRETLELTLRTMAVLALDSGVDELGCAPGDGGGGGAGAGHGICDQLGDGSGVLKVTIFQQGVGCVCGPCVGRSANKKKKKEGNKKHKFLFLGVSWLCLIL